MIHAQHRAGRVYPMQTLVGCRVTWYEFLASFDFPLRDLTVVMSSITRTGAFSLCILIFDKTTYLAVAAMG